MATKVTSPKGNVKIGEDELEKMITMFKALGDPSRLKIIAMLTQESKLSVSEIAHELNMSISRVSHHLKLLEHLGFVKHIQEGKEVYHRIEDDCIIDIMARAQEHVRGK